MSTSEQSPARTRMFARVLGPFFVLIAASGMVRASDMRVILSELGANSLWSWLSGGIELMGGLIIVAFHQYWRSIAAVIVSLLGWGLVLRGMVLLAFPHAFASAANSALDAPVWWRTGLVVVVLIGLYLAYIGWRPRSSFA